MQVSSKPNVALVLAAGFVILFIGGGARFAIGLTLKPMVEELGWLRGDLGLAVAVFQVVSAIFMFVAGKMLIACPSACFCSRAPPSPGLRWLA